MPVCRIIVGLPGSGKSELAKTLGGTVFDDPRTREELGCVRTMLDKGEDVVITDAWLCLEENLEVAKGIFPEAEIIFFQNDPEQCHINDVARGRDLLSQDWITHLSTKYNPPKGALDVFRSN